jgi:hypothetical protein
VLGNLQGKPAEPSQTRQKILGPSVSIFLALVTSFVSAEMLQINRFLRNVIHGHTFWPILFVLFVVIWIILWFVCEKTDRFQEASPRSVILLGLLAGLIGSGVAISISPLLLYGSLASVVSIWRSPLYLFYAIILSFGWLYGGLAAFSLFLILRQQYSRITLILVSCLLLGLLEGLPLVRWIRY